MDNVALTAEILIVFGLLGLTIVLFVTEIVRIDIGALIILFLIGVVGLIPDIEPILAPEKLFSGLSSNAVVAIIAVMIIGNGLDRAGVMTRIATVFLLAGLIPLGLVAQNSGAAAWLAVNGMNLMGDVPVWVMQVMLFLLVTFFTLFISNVGATVLLVPLAVSFALAAQANGIDADPRVFALIVAIAASNAFLLPTHQVNALILDPGGYHVIDFLRAGGLLTLLYPAVALVVTNLLF